MNRVVVIGCRATNKTNMSRYAKFQPGQIDLRNLDGRGHGLVLSQCWECAKPKVLHRHPDWHKLSQALRSASRKKRAAIAFIGGHPIKLGLARFVIDLMERGFITHLATNGAGVIHDFELAMAGGTSEDVAKWIRVGQFGLWQETSLLNDVVREAAVLAEGLGEGVGRYIEEHHFPHRVVSVTGAGWRLGIPVTGHVTIGADIIHSMPNCDGAALGATSYTDFLVFARSIQNLEGGVFLNIGSAVTGPEIYLKALSMARNVARQRGEEIRNFTTAVFDLVDLPDNWLDGPPGKDHPGYYYRPWKTILIRTVADGGKSYYIKGDHRETIPTLWHHLTQPESAASRPEAAALGCPMP